MKKLDYKSFEELLFRDCYRMIEEFSSTEFNRDVYSFCIYTQLGHGNMVLFINTLDSFNKKRGSGAYYTIQDPFYGLRNLKYSINDFGIPFKFSKDIEEFASRHATQELDKYEGWDPLIKGAINVCNQLDEQFNLLNLTEDFIAFNIIHDMDYDKQINLMKETVPLEKLYAAFPEIARFEQLQFNLHQMSKEEQMNYWISAYEDFTTDTEGEEVNYLKACRRNKYDVINMIKSFGKDISPKLMSLLQTYGKCEELNHEFASLPKEERVKRVKEDKSGTLSVWTKEGKITHELIDLVKSTGDEEMIKPLHELLQFWFSKTIAYPYDGIGRNVSLLSRALNSLSPGQFPYPSIDSGDRLENYHHFNLNI